MEIKEQQDNALTTPDNNLPPAGYQLMENLLFDIRELTRASLGIWEYFQK